MEKHVCIKEMRSLNKTLLFAVGKIYNLSYDSDIGTYTAYAENNKRADFPIDILGDYFTSLAEERKRKIDLID